MSAEPHESIPPALQERAWDVLARFRDGITTARELGKAAQITDGAALAMLELWTRHGYLEVLTPGQPFLRVYRVRDFVRRTESFLRLVDVQKPRF